MSDKHRLDTTPLQAQREESMRTNPERSLGSKVTPLLLSVPVVGALAITAGSAQGVLEYRTIQTYQGAEILFDSASPNVPQMVRLVAEASGVPMGMEALEPPMPPTWEHSQRTFVVSGRELTVALYLFEAWDPRYTRREFSNAVVVRPRNAWEDDGHFLNQRVDRFTLDDEDLVGALHAVRALFGHMDRIYGPVGGPAMTLSLSGASVLEILNAIVAAHGRATWMILPRPGAGPGVVTLLFSTADGLELQSGLRLRTRSRRDAWDNQ